MFQEFGWRRCLALVSGAALAASVFGVAASARANEDKPVIAIEYEALFFPYQTALKGVIDKYVKELGGVTVIDADSAQDTGKELSNVENFILRKPDCLLLSPVDFKSPAAAETAKKANLPFVSFDSRAGGPISAFVGYDQNQGGEVLAQFVIDQYKKIGKPKMQLMYLRGIIGHPTEAARDIGLKNALKAAGMGLTKSRSPSKRRISIAPRQSPSRRASSRNTQTPM